MKLIQEQDKCIGCGACAAVCPSFWEMKDEDGLAHLKGGQLNSETGEYEMEIEESQVACNSEAADSCPVQIIRIMK